MHYCQLHDLILISTFKLEAKYTSITLAILLTSTWYKYPTTEPTNTLKKRKCKAFEVNSLSIMPWNIRSLYRVGSLMTVVRELFRYRLDLVGVQEVRWEGSGTTPAGEYTFYMERGMRTMKWVQGFCT
jgi:hypothetical protein